MVFDDPERRTVHRFSCPNFGGPGSGKYFTNLQFLGGNLLQIQYNWKMSILIRFYQGGLSGLSAPTLFSKYYPDTSGSGTNKRGYYLASRQVGGNEILEFAMFYNSLVGLVVRTSTASGNPLIKLNDWNHVIITLDGTGTAGGFNWYLNGESCANAILLNNLGTNIINYTATFQGVEFLLGAIKTQSYPPGILYGLEWGNEIQEASFLNNIVFSPEDVKDITDQGIPTSLIDRGQLDSRYFGTSWQLNDVNDFLGLSAYLPAASPWFGADQNGVQGFLVSGLINQLAASNNRIAHL